MISTMYSAGDGGCRAQGETPGFLFRSCFSIILFLIFIFFCISGFAEEVPTEEIRGTWTRILPYVPENKEYTAELGGMWEQENFYWLGLGYGHHLGRCFWLNANKCQQYLDIIGGVGSREAFTQGLFLTGLRWQYVSYPKAFSPSVKFFVGLVNLRDNARDLQKGTAGIGLALTSTIHRNMDIKWETRFGQADEFWAQTLISFSLKIDRYVEDFKDTVIDVGETTGSVIKSTLGAPKTFVDWILQKKKSESDKKTGSQ